MGGGAPPPTGQHTHMHASPSRSHEGVNIHQQHLATRQQAATRKSLGYTHTNTRTPGVFDKGPHVCLAHAHDSECESECLLLVQSDKTPLTFGVSSSCRIRIRGAPPHTRPERQRLQQRCTNEQRGCVLSAQEPPSPRSPPSLSSSLLL